MSYSNLNIPALLISDGSMQANYLGSYWDADRVGIMGPRQISDLKSVLTLTARKYRTDWLKWYGALSMRRQEKWHHSESISNSDLRFTEGKFPMIDTARKRGSSQFAGFSRHQEAGPTSGSTSSLFCTPSKTAGGNVHLDRTPTSSSSSSFSWHQLQWVRVFVFLRLGIITMWCCHNPSSFQRHWYLFWFPAGLHHVTVQV